MHDYHIHSHFCRHATGRLDEYARAAIAAGLTEICFTPHIPLPGFRTGFYDDKLRMDPEEFPFFLRELEETRARFPHLTMLCGVEADYLAGWESYLAKFLSSYRFDFVLMSVHFLVQWPADQWVFNAGQDPRGLQRVYDDYLQAIREGIQTGLFDCVAHLDLIKQTGHPLLATHAAAVTDILELCLRRGMSAEINTSGTRKEIGETYPSADIIELMKSSGVPLVPGSDAHAPAQIALGFTSLPWESFVRYRGRRIVSPTSLAAG
jgi:histidinol-phosphatase (PHP family)